MEQDDFWELIQILGPRPHNDDFERLSDALATREADDIIGFEDTLTRLLSALDTPAHAAAARARNDWFLYVRCAAVAAGRTAYDEIVAEPAKLRRFARREAELLLSVASQAYERSTGMLWEHEPSLSYESGSNATAWGDPEPAPDPPPGHDPMPWLNLYATVALADGWPAAYVPLIDHIRQAMIADPAWHEWWSTAGVPECHLSLLLGDDQRLGATGITVKVGRTRVETHVVRQPEPFTGTDPQQVLPRAVDDVTAMIEALRAHLHLPAPPPLRLPGLPADIPTGTARLDTLTDILAGVGVGNLLKIAATGLFNRIRGRTKA